MSRSRSLISISVLLLGTGLLGCATAGSEDNKPDTDAKQQEVVGEAAKSPTEASPTEAPPAEAPPAEAPAGEASITVAGTLTYTELPKTMSVEAYLGKEFTLVDTTGTEHNLKSSDTVSHDDLVARSGQSIEVTCVPFPEKQPPSHVQAPTNGPDGGLMPYPAGCTVTALAPAK